MNLRRPGAYSFLPSVIGRRTRGRVAALPFFSKRGE